MKENGKNKREWIKTAAIIFLAVMLVLTFFSNTFMNYSLPEVATQYVMSDSITARIRGTGVVESGDPYEVMVNESRKVSSVAVRVGDEVQKGDILFYLEDSESEELKFARKALEDAEKILKAAEDGLSDARDNYYNALLNGDITAEDIQASNSGTSAAAYRQQITNIQTRITQAENELKPHSDKIASLDRSIADIDAQNAYEASQLAIAQSRLADAKSKLESFSNGNPTVSGNDSEYQKAEKAYEDAEKVYNDINNVITNLNNQRSVYVLEKYNAEKAYADAEKKLEAVRKELSDLITMLGSVQGLDSLKDFIADAQDVVDEAQKGVDEAQKEVKKLEEKSFGATITADISGTVTSINVTAGNNTSTMAPVAVLQPEGQGYTMSFSVTNEQARRLAVGDRADLVNAWRYDDVEVILASIKPDQNNPSQNKLLTFDITGDVVAGQTFSISVGQQSANFDLVVPNSAIREDSNGKFILIVETRSSPLGNRYMASRVDVQVLASDDTKSAISAPLYGYEYVITTSTQPVDAGQLVRLTNN